MYGPAEQAAGQYDSVISAMAGMTRMGREIAPQPEKYGFYRRKYEVFKRMYHFQQEIRGILA